MSIALYCSYDECKQLQATKYKTDLCSPHYWRDIEGRDMTKPIIVNRRGMTAYERVMCQVKTNGDCIDFTGYKMKSGYGMVAEKGGNSKSLAHRVVMEYHHGVSELNVLHSCDNPSCVKIEHLRYGTQKDNMNDAMIRDRTTRGERNTRAILTSEQVIAIFRDARPYKVLAEEFGCSIKNIGNIKQGVSWSWLTGK